MKKAKIFLAGFMAILILSSLLVYNISYAASGEKGLIMSLDFEDAAPANPGATFTIKDNSGNNNNVTLFNPKTTKTDTSCPSIKFEKGVFGNSLKLNGAIQYMQLPTATFNQPAISMAFWVNVNSSTHWQRFFEMGTCETGDDFLLVPYDASGKVSFSANNAKLKYSFLALPSDSSYSFPMNTWTHVALTMDSSGNTSFYINGKVVPMTITITKGTAKQTLKSRTSFVSPVSIKYVSTLTGLTNPSWYVARIGSSATTTWDPNLNGYFDSFKVYNRAISADEVNLLSTTNTTVKSSNSTASANTHSIAPSSTNVVSKSTSINSNATLTLPSDNTAVSTASNASSSAQSGTTSAVASNNVSTGASVSNNDSSISAANTNTNTTKPAQSKSPVLAIVLIVLAVLLIGGGVCIFVFKDKIFKKKT